jgi:Protein of unknown function (DUF3455)
MKRSRRTAAAIAGVSALPVIGVSAYGQAAASAASSAQLALTAARTISPVLAVPPGNKLAETMTVQHGSQVYTCAGGAWTLLEPVSVLHAGPVYVLNTKGPSWISVNDGSSVTGSVVASVPRPNAAPELLVKAVSNTGGGLLSHVDYIQRLGAIGGASPIGACADGAIDAVTYQAEYLFYVPGSATSPSSSLPEGPSGG